MHILELLAKLENYRQKIDSGELEPGTTDHTIRMCQAQVAELSDFRNRVSWVGALRSRAYLTKNGEINRISERLEIFYNRLRLDEIRDIYEKVFEKSFNQGSRTRFTTKPKMLSGHLYALTDIIVEIGSDSLEEMIKGMK